MKKIRFYFPIQVGLDDWEDCPFDYDVNPTEEDVKKFLMPSRFREGKCTDLEYSAAEEVVDRVIKELTLVNILDCLDDDEDFEESLCETYYKDAEKEFYYE